jgi:hypothetical protein
LKNSGEISTIFHQILIQVNLHLSCQVQVLEPTQSQEKPRKVHQRPYNHVIRFLNLLKISFKNNYNLPADFDPSKPPPVLPGPSSGVKSKEQVLPKTSVMVKKELIDNPVKKSLPKKAKKSSNTIFVIMKKMLLLI